MDRRAAREAVRIPVPSVPTFSQAAPALPGRPRVIGNRRPAWSNPIHAAQWESTLATYVFPFIGEMAVDEITAADVLAALEPIWTAKPETASKVKQRVETVMDLAVTH